MPAADERLQQLRDLLDTSPRIVVFTGAGISTESGIPDFRSPGGIWTKMQPIDFKDFLASEDMRREYWRRKFVVDPMIREAEPNIGHAAVAELVERGRVSSIITQNIDGLHQKSGVPADSIIELHGNSTYAACLDCRTRYELAPIRERIETTGEMPVCGECGGIVKSATISFGQPMPEQALLKAQTATLNCDLFLVVGSSLVVYPAAAFPEKARWNGASLAILNREATPLDPLADLVLHREIGPTLASVTGLGELRVVH